MRVSRLVAVAIGLFVTVFVLPGQAQSIRQPSSGALSYEAFMRLEQPQRALAYSELSVDDKEAMIHEHIGAWVKEHRESLSDEQVTHLARMAALLAPGTDREQTGDEFVSLTQTLTCQLWKSDFYAALMPHRPAPPGGVRGLLGDMASWFHECVVFR